MRDEPRNVAEWFRSSETGPGGWGVYSRVNSLFTKHRDKIWRCRPLIERIVEKCKVIFYSRCFRLEWLEIEFQERGPLFAVDGDRCCVYPATMDGDYADHNTDTPDQAFCLYLCLQTALGEIDGAISVWEERGATQLKDLTLDERRFRFTKDLTSWGLYKASIVYFDEPRLDRTLFVWATSLLEAREHLEAQPDLFGSEVILPNQILGGPPMRLVEIPGAKSEVDKGDDED